MQPSTPPRVGRYILYARKSTDREDMQILSIPAQLGELRAVAHRRGVTIADERTEHCSAREPGRPVFSQLLREIEAGKVDGLVCWSLDRLARNPIDGGALTHYLGKGLLREIVTHEAVYTGTGDTKFMLQVLFGAATKMTDDLSEGVKRGNRAVHERGRITGVPPIGYMKQRDTAFRRGAAPVVPDPERFELVRALWTDMATGTMTVSEAWRRAVERGLKSRTTKDTVSGPIPIQSVHLLLRNRFYAGTIARRDEQYPGEHTPMITPDQFARVQEFLASGGKPRASRNTFVYAGLLRCGHCGSGRLVGENCRGRARYYTYYRCHQGEHDVDRAPCRSPAPREEQITADIEAFLERVTLPEPLLRWSLEAIEWWYAESRDRVDEIVASAKNELAAAERRLTSLTDLVVEGVIDKTEYADRKATLQDELERLRHAVASPTAELEERRRVARDVVQLGAVIAEDFRKASNEERRRLLAGFCSNHIVTDRKTAPILRFPYTILAEPRPTVTSRSGDRSNHPPSPATVLGRQKNARTRSRVAREYLSWCAKLLNVRIVSTDWGPCLDIFEEAHTSRAA